MNSLLSRKVYPSTAEAIEGGIKQYVASLVGVPETIEQRQAKVEVRARVRLRADVKHRELMAGLRKRNQEAIAVKELTSEMVYPKRGFK